MGGAPTTVIGDVAGAAVDGKKTPHLDRRKSLADKLKRGWATMVRAIPPASPSPTLTGRGGHSLHSLHLWPPHISRPLCVRCGICV